jgi:hypothetical protein
MKPSDKIRKRQNREQRRLEYGAARAAFLLAGGHKDHVTPFHMSWRYNFAYMTRSLEAGDSTYTHPRSQHGDSTTYRK